MSTMFNAEPLPVGNWLSSQPPECRRGQVFLPAPAPSPPLISEVPAVTAVGVCRSDMSLLCLASIEDTRCDGHLHRRVGNGVTRRVGDDVATGRPLPGGRR